MKKTILALIALASVFSCNNGKKNNDQAAEKESEIQTEKESQSASTLFETAAYAERGLQYALTTQAVLGKNLKQAIENSGTSGALAFCNEKAFPLTDSMAVVHNAKLKRVSDKPRNQTNQANTEELGYIETFKQGIKNQELPNPLVIESDSKVQVYYPILTSAMCLQCHGKPTENIEPSTLKKLAILYPKDKAIGYDNNEVRGIWSVTFDK